MLRLIDVLCLVFCLGVLLFLEIGIRVVCMCVVFSGVCVCCVVVACLGCVFIL